MTVSDDVRGPGDRRRTQQDQGANTVLRIARSVGVEVETQSVLGNGAPALTQARLWWHSHGHSLLLNAENSTRLCHGFDRGGRTDMQSASAGVVTRLLRAWSEGNPHAEEKLLPIVYDELRRRAAGHLRRDRRDHTLQPTALVHEAYLRLLGQREVDWQSRAHFFALASRMMRRILVDHARARAAAKRPDGALRVTLDASSRALIPAGAISSCWIRRCPSLLTSTSGKAASSSCVTSADSLKTRSPLPCRSHDRR